VPRVGEEMNERDALKLGLQLVETAEYLATDSAICGNYVKEERALIQQSKIAFEEALAQSDQESDDLTIAYTSGFFAGKKNREWVGLTEEDIQPAIRKAMIYYGYDPKHSTLTSGAGFCELIRAIEAKLREKNEC